MTTPPLGALQRNGTHRLIPSRYSEQGTVLAGVCDNDAMLADVALLDGANDRIQGEQRGLPGISPYELVYGIPNAHIVNAAFTHANQAGGRFNTGIRGAWYAALEQKTSLAEVVYHKARRLADIVVPELPGQRPDREVSTCDDWLADFMPTFMRSIRRSATQSVFSQSRCPSATPPRSSSRTRCSTTAPTESFIPACGAPPDIAWSAFVPRWSPTRAAAIA
jgi:hypothetical protein